MGKVIDCFAGGSGLHGSQQARETVPELRIPSRDHLVGNEPLGKPAGEVRSRCELPELHSSRSNRY